MKSDETVIKHFGGGLGNRCGETNRFGHPSNCRLRRLLVQLILRFESFECWTSVQTEKNGDSQI